MGQYNIGDRIIARTRKRDIVSGIITHIFQDTTLTLFKIKLDKEYGHCSYLISDIKMLIRKEVNNESPSETQQQREEPKIPR